MRGLAHYLQQPRGRLFQYTCDADLGDHRCGVDLTLAAYRADGSIVAVGGDRTFRVAGLDGHANDWFTRGLLRFTSGAATGQAVEVKRHSKTATAVEIELWQAARAPLAVGQTFVVTAGCDKHLETCRDRFSNVVNHRGFPHMPGNDFITTIARGAR